MCAHRPDRNETDFTIMNEIKKKDGNEIEG